MSGGAERFIPRSSQIVPPAVIDGHAPSLYELGMAGTRVERAGTSAGAAELEAELALLCQHCALCCDGTLFGRVPLSREEVAPARARKLRVLASGKGFEQTCTALVPLQGADSHRTCSIYDERPLACRRFVCRLFDRHRREGGPLAPRLDAVRRVRELVTELELLGPEKARATPSFQELGDRLAEDFARA